MGFNEKENSLEYWDNIHSKYERNEIKLDDWLDKFETIIDSCSTPILDLGCGSGNDTLYLINKNKQVIPLPPETEVKYLSSEERRPRHPPPEASP